MILPKARTADIVEQEVDRELMIYDLRIDKAYNLNETLKIVFRACNGQTTFDNLEHRHKFTTDIIHLSLDELAKHNLLEDNHVSPFAGMNRREIIRRIGFASLITLPILSSLVAPAAVNAASGCTTGASGRALGCPCTAITQCRPPSSACCLSSSGASNNQTCVPNNTSIANGGACGNSCSCTSNCCASNTCVAAGALATNSACTINCQCTSGTCSGGLCT